MPVFHGDMPVGPQKFGLMSDIKFLFQKLHVFIYKK